MKDMPASKIPDRLTPYFQEYDVAQINLAKDANLVIQRTIEYGTWDEIRWLFQLYGSGRIRVFIREHGERLLTPVTFNYWRLLLRIRKWKRSPFAIPKSELWPY